LANHPSALKRARQNEKRRIRNKSVKTRIKSSIKKVRETAAAQSADSAVDALNTAKSALDRAAQKGIVHHKTVARKISRLSKMVNNLSS